MAKKTNKKEKVVTLKMSLDDYAELRSFADEYKMNVSEFIRYKSFKDDASLSANNMYDLIDELNILSKTYNQSGSKTWQFVNKNIYHKEVLDIHIESKVLIRNLLRELYEKLGK